MKWEAAEINCLLFGWKQGQIFHLAVGRESRFRRLFLRIPIFHDVQALMEYLL